MSLNKPVWTAWIFQLQKTAKGRVVRCGEVVQSSGRRLEAWHQTHSSSTEAWAYAVREHHKYSLTQIFISNILRVGTIENSRNKEFLSSLYCLYACCSIKEQPYTTGTRPNSQSDRSMSSQTELHSGLQTPILLEKHSISKMQSGLEPSTLF